MHFMQDNAHNLQSAARLLFRRSGGRLAAGTFETARPAVGSTGPGGIVSERSASGVPTESELRERRQREIVGLLRRARVAGQAEIVERLRQRGIEATQSSVSRDLRDLGVTKVAGRYVPPPQRREHPEDLAAAAHLLRSVKPAGPFLAVVQTLIGAAQTVALAIDHAELPEIVGTLAGDDTVFVATSSPRDQKRVLQRLETLMLETEP
jgi:transcriptional regulator of arginine metabolism